MIWSVANSVPSREKGLRILEKESEIAKRNWKRVTMEMLVFEVSEDQFNNLPDDSTLEVTFHNIQNTQHPSHQPRLYGRQFAKLDIFTGILSGDQNKKVVASDAVYITVR